MCLDDEGSMMVMLGLVTVGTPCVGQEGLLDMPKIHPEMRTFSGNEPMAGGEWRDIRDDG